MSSDDIAGRTVMVVDDIDDVRSMLAQFLVTAGHRVVEAADGQQAVELARRCCPDLILMDLNMPVLDGLSATERIRGGDEPCRDVPVIAMTAYDSQSVKRVALKAGCNGYVAKPICFDSLGKIMSRIFGG